ncbi:MULTISPECIES: hypothetical protein [unclassified Streptomyces]|uniref:hypothetical protein n=1 Tax=unclassified Streptomyces TaxID=2593676 RepID=UPI002E2B307F|nr:hypothetical protein [Streptomyces sp. NBC_00223]
MTDTPALAAMQQHTRHCPMCARGTDCATGVGLTRRWIALAESAARGVRVPLPKDAGGIEPEPATEGTCQTCQQPIPPGAGRTYAINQATGAAPDVLLHTDPRDCVRRSL